MMIDTEYSPSFSRGKINLAQTHSKENVHSKKLICRAQMVNLTIYPQIIPFRMQHAIIS